MSSIQVAGAVDTSYLARCTIRTGGTPASPSGFHSPPVRALVIVVVTVIARPPKSTPRHLGVARTAAPKTTHTYTLDSGESARASIAHVMTMHFSPSLPPSLPAGTDRPRAGIPDLRWRGRRQQAACLFIRPAGTCIMSESRTADARSDSGLARCVLECRCS